MVEHKPSSTRDVLMYLVHAVPRPEMQGKGYLMQLAFLCDWKSALHNAHLLTCVSWSTVLGIPLSEEVSDELGSEAFTSVTVSVPQGMDSRSESCLRQPRAMERVTIADNATIPAFSEPDRKVIDYVIRKCEDLTLPELISLVVATYPLETQSGSHHVDLLSLAASARKRQKP